MKNICRSVGAALLIAAAGSAADWPLRVQQGTLVTEPTRAKVVEGRLEGNRAVLIEQGHLQWTVADLGAAYFIEFWLKPVAWTALTAEEILLCEFAIGGAAYRLAKVGGSSELALRQDDKLLQVYPIYGWDEAAWSAGMGRRRVQERSVGWHHVHLAVSDHEVRLTVDGFPARAVAEAVPPGPVREIKLDGNPGTIFEALVVSRGGPFSSQALRDRYLAAFLSQPKVLDSIVTVPYLAAPPTADGVFSAEEWRNAARITGFVSVRDGQVLAEEVTGYIGYDSDRLYLALITPYKGELEATHWGKRDQALWLEESYEIFIGPPFISGERPRRLFQLIGNPHGDQADFSVLPSRDARWQGKWTWAVTIADDRWIAEFAARFEDLELPVPRAGEPWSARLVNTKANAAYPMADGSYSRVEGMCTLRFEPRAPVIRPGIWTVSENNVTLPLEIQAGNDARKLTAGMHVFGDTDMMPAESFEKPVIVRAGQAAAITLDLPMGNTSAGRIAVYVKDGDQLVYYHSVGFPQREGRSK